jgi:hypothetical protein
MWQLDDQIMANHYPLLVPQASAFFAVDGECRFHAVGDYRAGYATGILSEQQEIELSRELAYTELLRTGTQWFQHPAGCSDFPGLVATTSAGTVSCACGCPAQTPEAISAALQTNAEVWLERLLEQGQPVSASAVSAIAMPRGTGYLPPGGEPKAWPLARTMDEVPNLKLSDAGDRRWVTGPYARIEDATEIAALRALRMANLLEKAYVEAGVQILEGDAILRLFVRDELPEDVALALKAFQTHDR